MAPLKVLIISHASVLALYQVKLKELAKFADIRPTLLIPPSWPESGFPTPAEKTSDPAYRIEVGKIFYPFFTTKDPGHGTGLGLWIVYSIIENHCGTIRVESEKGKGAQFVIFLPKHLPGREDCGPADKK